MKLSVVFVRTSSFILRPYIFIPYCNQHPYESSNINIRGTIHILKAARKYKPEKVFFASTAAVYPIYDNAVNETFATGPMDIYGLSKLTGRAFVQ
ncbi:MAG: NAD-dependent epimerase/dehydratase family protein [Bacteroidia bacterium]